MEKTMRMHSVSSTIENGFVHVPLQADWLPEYLHEMSVFPKGKYDDQVDSTSQALDWFKNDSLHQAYGLLEFFKKENEKVQAEQQAASVPDSRHCASCNGVMSQRIPGGLRCAQCGAQWLSPSAQPRVPYLSRADIFHMMRRRRW